MKTAVLSLMISLSLILSICAFPCRAEPIDSLSLSAGSAVLIAAEDGSVLAQKNAHARMGMASTTKILTALVALERLELDKTVKIPKEAVGIEGSSVYLVEGEELTVRELLFALMLASANDAAVALAIAACGDVESFVGRMNEYVEQMGLENTHLTNPHGLNDDDHYTTAYELALIAKKALENDTLRDIVSTYKTTVRYCGKKGGRVLVNHNKMLKLYSGAIGLKTGFTKATGRCLVSAAQKNGLTLISVTLNAPDDWNDHIRMLNFGFDNYRLELFADKGDFSYQMDVVGGDQSSARLTNSSRIAFVVPVEHSGTKYRIESTSRFEYAPVVKGNFVATLIVECQGKTATSELIADHSVKKT